MNIRNSVNVVHYRVIVGNPLRGSFQTSCPPLRKPIINVDTGHDAYQCEICEVQSSVNE